MMKHFYLFCMAVLACAASLAQSTITLVSTDGSWSSEQDWTPSRLPAQGDIVVIPSDKTVKVNKSISFSNIHLKVYGKVLLVEKSTKVDLDGNSDVYVYEGGSIGGTEANQQLRIGSNIVYLGNTPPVVGPAFATVTSSSFTATILPVKFLSFSVARQNSDVLVQWSTTEEVAAGSFEVERSIDCATWIRTATLPAKGSLSTVTTYSITDKNMTAAVAYYRVKQVDVDGKFTYTALKTVKNTTTGNDVTIAAVNNRVVLQFPATVKGAVEVRLVSLSGHVVSRQVLQQPAGQVVLNTTPVKGAYVVAVSTASDLLQTRQVIL